MSEIPETLTRAEANRKLLAHGWTMSETSNMLDNARGLLAGRGGRVFDETRAILEAHVRHLDAHEEPTPTLDVCEALRAASVLLNHASKDMIVAGLAEDGVSVTEANMTILNVLAKLSRKDSAS